MATSHSANPFHQSIFFLTHLRGYDYDLDSYQIASVETPKKISTQNETLKCRFISDWFQFIRFLFEWNGITISFDRFEWMGNITCKLINVMRSDWQRWGCFVIQMKVNVWANELPKNVSLNFVIGANSDHAIASNRVDLKFYTLFSQIYTNSIIILWHLFHLRKKRFAVMCFLFFVGLNFSTQLDWALLEQICKEIF